MDSLLLALCFIAMGMLVLAWAMLPHGATEARQVGHSFEEATAGGGERALGVQVA